MNEFFNYLKQRLYFFRFLLHRLSIKKLVVLASSFWALLWKRSKSGRVPPILIIKLTSRCNLSCIMCPKTSRSIDFYKNPVDMDFDKLKKLLEENAKYITLVQLHGGEPLMHKQINDILDLLNDLNLMYTITTNGHFLTPEIISKITKNCLRIIVSIDAVTPELYAKIRKGGNLAEIVNNIEMLNQVKHENKISLPLIRIVMAVFAYNMNEMQKMIKFSHDLDIDLVIFQEGILYDNPEVGSDDLIENNISQMYQAVSETSDLARKLKVAVRFDFHSWGKKPIKTEINPRLKRCFYLYFTMLLQERFNVTYCFGSYDYTFPLSKHLSDTWNENGYYFYSARNNLKKNIVPLYCSKAFQDGINCILNASEYN
jgi:molybdenum cofactor biosynthesis enzyme MoaA